MTPSSFSNFENNSLHLCPLPSMIAYEGSKSAWEEKFGEFINRFKPEIKTLVKKLERMSIKLNKQCVFIFNLCLGNVWILFHWQLQVRVEQTGFLSLGVPTSLIWIQTSSTPLKTDLVSYPVCGGGVNLVWLGFMTYQPL